MAADTVVHMDGGKLAYAAGTGLSRNVEQDSGVQASGEGDRNAGITMKAGKTGLHGPHGISGSAVP